MCAGSYFLFMAFAMSTVSSAWQNCAACRCSTNYKWMFGAGLGLTAFPQLAPGAAVLAEVLGLQRNRILQLDVPQLMHTFSALQLLDVHEQVGHHFVDVSERFPGKVTVLGMFNYSISPVDYEEEDITTAATTAADTTTAGDEITTAETTSESGNDIISAVVADQSFLGGVHVS